jgi:hypothetical protein
MKKRRRRKRIKTLGYGSGGSSGDDQRFSRVMVG